MGTAKRPWAKTQQYLNFIINIIMWPALARAGSQKTALIDNFNVVYDIAGYIKLLLVGIMVEGRIWKQVNVIRNFIIDKLDDVYMIQIWKFPLSVYNGCTSPAIIEARASIITKNEDGEYILVLNASVDRDPELHTITNFDLLINNLARAGAQVYLEAPDGLAIGGILTYADSKKMNCQYMSPWHEQQIMDYSDYGDSSDEYSDEYNSDHGNSNYSYNNQL